MSFLYRTLCFVFFCSLLLLHITDRSVISHSAWMRLFSPTEVHDQVFFNYRGEQLRYNFISHLTDAFERYKIKFLVDSYEQRGKDLNNLFVRIEESSVALAIFSTRYAESRWCMDELVKMKKLTEQGKLHVIPIFYKVEAQDVRGQEGEFGDNFWKLARTSRGDQIQKWKDALESISDKMGLTLGEKSSEADFIKIIATEVQRVIITIRAEEEEKHIWQQIKREMPTFGIIMIFMHVCYWARVRRLYLLISGAYSLRNTPKRKLTSTN